MDDNPIQGFQQITSITLRQVIQREFPVFFQLTREVEVMDSQGTVPRPFFALYSCERLRSKPTTLAYPPRKSEIWLTNVNSILQSLHS